MTRFVAAVILLTLVFETAPASAKENRDLPDFATKAPEPPSGDPAFAFNGKDLSGFSTYLSEHKDKDPLGVFSVVDGAIRVSGEEYGGFITRDEYSDYHLVVEWRWGKKSWPPRVGKTHDSGILVHGVGPEGAAGGYWLESIECQLIEGGSGDFILVAGKGHPEMSCEVRKGANNQLYFQPGGEKVTRSSGRYNWWGRDPGWMDVEGFRGARDVENPAGEWNLTEVICDGDTITVYVNGILVNKGTDSNRTKGKIEFQSEGSEIHFRKIEVRPLKKS